MSQTKTQIKWPIASVALQDAYTDFYLSRQAMNCAETTLLWYQRTAGKFLQWIEHQGVTNPEEVTARFVRAYLAMLADRGKQDTTLHAHARAIRTLLKFWHAENYLSRAVTFEMPKLFKKRLPVLTVDELQKVLKACDVRARAVVLFLVDSGLRRAEAVALNWSDINFQSGRVQVRRGKGKKDRTAAIGATTRRALLAYRRTLLDRDGTVFQTRDGRRFVSDGFVQIFNRLEKKTGIRIRPHMLRRTFTILSLRAGMNPLHLQNLGGWTSLDMVQHYAGMVDDDLLAEHKAHSPIDSLRD